MIDTFLNFIIYSSLFFTPQCNIQKSDNIFLSVCSSSGKYFAIEIDLSKYGSFKYGEWKDEFIGYGLSGEIVDEQDSENCADFKYEKTFEGKINFDYEKSISKLISNNLYCVDYPCPDGYNYFYDQGLILSIGNFNKGDLEGFSIQNDFLELNPYIGFLNEGKFNGEGILYEAHDQKFTHGIWKSGMLIKTLKIIELNKILINKPICKENK